MNDNNENIEEVPLDLFDQVSLDETKPAEPVQAVEAPVAPAVAPSKNVISIPANAYNAVISAERQAQQQQPQ